jgi:hypothetical protein
MSRDPINVAVLHNVFAPAISLCLRGSDTTGVCSMPKIQIKVEGTTKMIKTVLVNINEVCQAIGRPVDCESPPMSPRE